MIYFLTETCTHLRRGLIQRGASIGSLRFGSFADGERSYRLLEDVARERVSVMGSVWPDPASLFDLLSAFRVLRENRSRPPEFVIPYLGYARQDTHELGEAAIGLFVSELLRNMNPSVIRVVDPHSDAVAQAFGESLVRYSAIPLIGQELSRGDDVEVVVAPDEGARERAEQLAALLPNLPAVAVMEKHRPKPNTAVIKSLHGDVRGKRVVIVDDIIDTGGTIIAAVKMLREEGASTIRVAATHGIFSQNARERLLRLPIEDLIVTNTLPQTREERLRILDIAPLLIQP